MIILEIIGGFYTLLLLLRIAYWIYQFTKAYYVSPLLGLAVDVARLGSWGVVTGATDGMGKAYAELLAARGLNIVLISRSKEKLDRVAASIRAEYRIIVKTVVFDFTSGAAAYSVIRKELQGLDIGVLVNHVGASLPGYPENFHLLTNESRIGMVHCNVLSVTYMTEMVLPVMVRSGRGAIINICSSARVGIPLLSLYSATKQYMAAFCHCLQAEYAKSGIIVQCISTGQVITPSGVLFQTEPSFFVPTASAYVKAAMATVGVAANITGYARHEIQSVFSSMLPQKLLRIIMFNYMKNQRRIIDKKLHH